MWCGLVPSRAARTRTGELELKKMKSVVVGATAAALVGAGLAYWRMRRAGAKSSAAPMLPDPREAITESCEIVIPKGEEWCVQQDNPHQLLFAQGCKVTVTGGGTIRFEGERVKGDHTMKCIRAVSGAAVMLRDITVVGGGVSADARGGDSPCSLVLENVSIVGVPKCAIMAFGGGTVAMNGGGIEAPPEVFDALVWVAGKGSKASLTGCALKVHGGKSSLATMDDGELAVSSCSLNGEALAWRANAGYPFGNGGKSWPLPGAKNK